MLPWIRGLVFLAIGQASSATFVPTTSTFAGKANHRQRPRNIVQRFNRVSSSATETADEKGASLSELRSRSVADLKKELTCLDVGFDDVFEKEGLVRRLYEAMRQSPNQTSKSAPTSSFVATDSPFKPAATPSRAGTDNIGDNSNSQINDNVIRTPLYFASGSDIQLAAVEGLMFSPTDQPFATIRIQVHDKNKQDSSSGDFFTLSLLLDTACSGIVLRPQVVEKYGLPKLQTPVTMTGAGGTAQNTGLTQLSSFSLEEGSATNAREQNDKKKNRFGPLPAAVQDIDVLPRQLDGIIGLSFLSQFAGIELDFAQGHVSLFRHQMPSIEERSNRSQIVVAQGDLTLVGSLGIYTVATKLGGRGPVSLLVDSGAGHTLLNWKGVADLGLSRQSPPVTPLDPRMMMGAMGSDNAVMQFTHRLHVSSLLNFDNGSNSKNNYSQVLPGLSLQGDERRRLPIDIGNIPILDALQSQGVGGLLGVDVMMRCAAVQMTFRGPKQRITLIN